MHPNHGAVWLADLGMDGKARPVVVLISPLRETQSQIANLKSSSEMGHGSALDSPSPDAYPVRMNYGVLFERIEDRDFPPGHYYAHIPSLGLTTHGLGVEGARSAARDLLQEWIAEKRANQESVPTPGELFFSTLELPEDAIQSA